MKGYLKDIVDEYDVSTSMSQVGLVDYSGLVVVRVLLKDNYGKEQFKRLVEQIPRSLGGGSLEEALSKVRRDVFSITRGECTESVVERSRVAVRIS